jgi:hypothetical protein
MPRINANGFPFPQLSFAWIRVIRGQPLSSMFGVFFTEGNEYGRVMIEDEVRSS